jgi:hypothetical protein
MCVCAPFVSSMPKEDIVLKLGHALAAVSYVTQHCEGEKTVSFIVTPQLGYERLSKKHLRCRLQLRRNELFPTLVYCPSANELFAPRLTWFLYGKWYILDLENSTVIELK